MNDALNRMSLSAKYGPSRRSMSRIASASKFATSNIIRAFHKLRAAPSASPRCLSALITDAKIPSIEDDADTASHFSFAGRTAGWFSMGFVAGLAILVPAGQSTT
jgi:hypothetical protein